MGSRWRNLLRHLSPESSTIHIRQQPVEGRLVEPVLDGVGRIDVENSVRRIDREMSFGWLPGRRRRRNFFLNGARRDLEALRDTQLPSTE